MDETINQIIANYQIAKFERAFPNSRYQHLRKVYLIKTNSMQLMLDLLNTSPLLFYEGQIKENAQLTYTPNDYGLTPVGTLSGQKDLDLINAEAAWNITKGDASIIIGITDTYFDVNHEDLVNQIVNIRANNIPNNIKYLKHGTYVAGAAASETNNNKGNSGVAFNCKLDVSSTWGSHNELLNMSNDGIRILNASWFHTCSYNNTASYRDVYNEIYENGTIACFGAGNGYAFKQVNGNLTGEPIQNHCDLGPTYPGGLDHNISVTSVGCENPIGTIGNWGGIDHKWNWMDVHENDIGLYHTATQDFTSSAGNIITGQTVPIEVHNHNHTVDISAPGYTVRTPEYGGGYRDSHGTSFASPLVAGTFGLMLSTNKWLTPYQLEYGIKTTAHNIYNITENQPYIGQLGAGRLDAGAAVSWADGHDPNSLFTTTMHIKGIKINTICQPGSASNGVLPQLEVIVENGTAPYTYKWETIAGNNTTLDAYDISNPTIIASSANHLVYYRVTVYDNSQVQKVASKVVKIQLTSQQSYDIAMRDSYMDMLNEPNDQINLDDREWNIWESQDLWNRQTQDGILEHENPEYFSTKPNYVYARVRNIGCVASPALLDEDKKGLRLYWSKASTGEDWAGDWTTTNVTGTGGASVPGGRQITTDPISIPVLQPGDEIIVSHEWYPQEPEAYDPTINTVDVCFLGRIVENSQSPYGMTTAEVSKVKDNILNNNNITTRNFIVTNFRPGNHRKRHQILVANAEEHQETFDIQLINERAINPHFSGNMSSVGFVTVFMGDLFDRWVDNGMQGNYGRINTEQRSITFDGSETMYLRNIPLNAKEKMSVILEFTLRDGGFSEVPFTVHFRQLLAGADPNNFEEHPIYGNVTYRITPTEKQYKKKAIVEENEIVPFYAIFPNPTTESLNIKYIGEANNIVNVSIVDANGRIVKQQNSLALNTSEVRNLDVKDLPSGVYFVIIKDTNGHSEQHKFVKI